MPQHPRRKIGLTTLIIIGLILGFIFKNIKFGLIIGIIIGLLCVAMVSNKEK